MFNDMDELCSVKEHYLPYKNLLLSNSPPSVPYLGSYLRDLTLLEIGNVDYLGSSKNIVNYEKFRMIAAVLKDIRKYQESKFTFTQDPLIQTALRYSLKTLDDDELYELSCELEPINVQ